VQQAEASGKLNPFTGLIEVKSGKQLKQRSSKCTIEHCKNFYVWILEYRQNIQEVRVKFSTNYPNGRIKSALLEEWKNSLRTTNVKLLAR
jgi:hypothetical protein